MAAACEIPISQPQSSASIRYADAGKRRSTQLINPLRIVAVVLAFLAPFVPLAYKVMNEIATHDPLAQPQTIVIRAFAISIFSLVLSCNVVRWINMIEDRR